MGRWQEQLQYKEVDLASTLEGHTTSKVEKNKVNLSLESSTFLRFMGNNQIYLLY